MYPCIPKLFPCPFILCKVMANLVEHRKFRVKNFFECFCHLLEDYEPVQDSIVSSGIDCIEIVLPVGGVRREISHINMALLWMLLLCKFKKVRSKPMPEATGASMHLEKERICFNAALQFQEVISSPETSQLVHTTFRLSFATVERLPRVIYR